jgi:mRNA-degrading endonuclease toxin of MazEF toxin-antitoxin module
MARILRGEIRWADLNPVRGKEQVGLRPVLIVSHDVFNERSGTVIAVAITSQPPPRGFSADTGIEFEGFTETLVGQDQPSPHAGCGANREEARMRHFGRDVSGH